MSKNSTTYTTPVSFTVLIAGVLRDAVVRVFDGVPRVVEPAFFGPLDGYHPMLPHYTQHACNAVRKTAHEDAYANRRFSLLVTKAETRQGNKRGQKNLEPMNLFEMVEHMTSFSPETWPVERVQKLNVDLAAQF